MKVLIEIRGGCLVGIYSTSEKIQFTSIDHDTVDESERKIFDENAVIVKEKDFPALIDVLTKS